MRGYGRRRRVVAEPARHAKDPREDEEQMEYLREWSEKHGKANRKE